MSATNPVARPPPNSARRTASSTSRRPPIRLTARIARRQRRRGALRGPAEACERTVLLLLVRNGNVDARLLSTQDGIVVEELALVHDRRARERLEIDLPGLAVRVERVLPRDELDPRRI